MQQDTQSTTLPTSNISPRSTIIKLAWPIIVEQLLLTLTLNIDTIMLSMLGRNATGAVGINTSILNLVDGFVMAVGIGFTAIIARFTGEQNHERVRKSSIQGAVVAVALGILLTLTFTLLSSKIPVWMGGEKDILADASNYLFWVSVSLGLKTFSILFTAIFRGIGDTKTPLKINMCVNILNVVANFLLIYPTRVITLFGISFNMIGAGLGVKGAGMATSVAVLIGAVLMFWNVFFKKSPVQLSAKDSYRPDFPLLKQIFTISLPATGERLAMNLGHVIQTFMATSIGTVALSAHFLATTVEGLAFMPPYGFATAVTTLTGQALGAKNEELAETYAKETVKLATILMTVISAVMFILAPQILRIFIDDAEVISIAALSLRIVLLSEPFLAVYMAIFGAMRGAGDTKWPFYIVMISMWCTRIIPSMLAVSKFGAGLEFIWVFIAVDTVVRCVFAVIRFKTGKWKKAYATADLT